MLSLRTRIQPNRQRPPQLTRPVSPTPDDQRRPPEPPREDEPPRVALIPASFKSERVPNPRWTIQQLLDTTFPPPADPRTITISPTFSSRGPTELDSAMSTVPVPPLTYVTILRDRAIRAIREGSRSILSPYGDGRRYPLWIPIYWSEITHVVEISAQYHEARKWLNVARVSRRTDGNLIPRIFDDWKKQPWSDLHRDLKADDPTAHLPQPDRLLPIISDRWLEDDQMDLLIRLTSVSVREQKKSGIVVPLRFWRELEHLDISDGFFDSGHYPCLTDTWTQISRGNLDLGFIVNNADGHIPGDKGTHWSAAVLRLSKGEFRYGDSLDRPPPHAFQGRLERWLRMYDRSGRRLQRGKDLKHATQTDGHSCGLISINSLEHYFLRYPLWTPEMDADIRLSKYINLLEYNRGPPIPPPGRQPRSRSSSANSASTEASIKSRSRPERYYGDIPVEGEDVRVLRGWTPEEGAGAGSRYQVVGPPRPDLESRLVPQSQNPSQENLPSSQMKRLPAPPPRDAPQRLNGNGGPMQPLTSQDPNIDFPPHQVISKNTVSSRPIPMRDAPSHHASNSRDVVIPSSEWERSDERGRRPRPIKPPPSPAPREAPILPIPDLALTRIGPPSNGRRISSSQPMQPVPFPTTQSTVPTSSHPPTSGPNRSGQTRSKVEPLGVPEPRSRRTSGSSLGSIWKSVKNRVTSGPSPAPTPISGPSSGPATGGPVQASTPQKQSRSPSPAPSSLNASSSLVQSSTNESRGRSETLGDSPRRRRKSSLKSVERGPGEQRAPGLSVKFSPGHEIENEINGRRSRRASRESDRQEGQALKQIRGTSPSAPSRGQRRSTYSVREAISLPTHFSMDDPTLPPTKRPDAIEARYGVLIDVETGRLVVHGSRPDVSDAIRELQNIFREFENNNRVDSFKVSRRAGHRISLWASCQRLQKETNTHITVEPGNSMVVITGPKNVLPAAKRSIQAFARQVDDEKHTHYIVPSSKDLRRVLMIALPRIISQCGGPEDEDEGRQMFTITNPGEGGPLAEMVVDLWCHPSMSEALKEGLIREVEAFTHNRMREVWALRIPSWRIHALRNSHIFRLYDDPAKVPDGQPNEGVPMIPLHTLEKRLAVQIAWPDLARPSWDNQPVKNMPSPRPGDVAEIPLTKLRGSQAQLPTAIAELEDRMRRLLQLTLRVPGHYHRELKTPGVAKRLESMGVDVQMQDPVDGHFECLLSAVRQEDLDAGQTDISRMANRITKGLPPLPTAAER